MELRRWVRRITSPRDIGLRRFGHPLPPPAWVPASTLPGARAAGDAGHVFLFGRWCPPATTPSGVPDWHADPVGAVQWPSDVETNAIPIRDDDRPGDVKYVWEPSRFLHLFDLVADPSGARVAADHVGSWIDQNPRGLGVHWDNALEASLRAISWTFADGVVGRRRDPDWEALRPRLLSALWHHGDFIASHLSTGQFNHLVGDAAGLAVLGASYSGLPDAPGWRETGVDILLEESGRQVLPDGSHAELAPAYARFVADLYLLAGHVCGEARLVATAERLVEALLLQSLPDGSLPGHGDDDGATVLWSVAPEGRFHVTLAVTAALTGRGGFSRARDGGSARSREIVGRVLGPDHVAAYDAIAPAVPEGTGALLPSAGLGLHRTSWERDADWVLLRGGPMGVTHGAHAHADLLTVQCHGPSLPSIVDPGTPTYNGDDAERTRSTGTAAHNTVCVDGHSQAVRSGRFSWTDMPCAGDLVSTCEGDEWRAAGTVLYVTPCGNVEHRREVVFRRGTLTIRDRVHCPGEHHASARFLVAGGGDETRGRQIRTDDGREFRLESTGWEDIACSAAAFSPGYGRALPASELILTCRFTDTLDACITLRRSDD